MTTAPTTPQHGDRRNLGTRTTVGAAGASAVTVTVAERYCRAHGWVETAGVVGGFGWYAEHEDCASRSSGGGIDA
jgi:hypothetical protein